MFIDIYLSAQVAQRFLQKLITLKFNFVLEETARKIEISHNVVEISLKENSLQQCSTLSFKTND